MRPDIGQNMSCAVVVLFTDPPPKRKGEFGNKTSTVGDYIFCNKGDVVC